MRPILLLGLALLLPAFATASLAPQDDAGSGGDAPDEPDASFAIVPGERTLGAIVWDGERDWDHYAFSAHAGARVTARVAGVETCVRIVDATGAPLAGDAFFNQDPRICSLSWGTVLGSDEATIESAGTYFLAVTGARAVSTTPYDLALRVE